MSNNILTGVIVNEQTLTLEELSNACLVKSTWIITLVDEGVIEPKDKATDDWLFSGACIQRVQTVRRLELDLGVNIAGAALIVDLLEENERLKNALEHMKTTIYNLP